MFDSHVVAWSLLPGAAVPEGRQRSLRSLLSINTCASTQVTSQPRVTSIATLCVPLCPRCPSSFWRKPSWQAQAPAAASWSPSHAASQLSPWRSGWPQKEGRQRQGRLGRLWATMCGWMRVRAGTRGCCSAPRASCYAGGWGTLAHTSGCDVVAGCVQLGMGTRRCVCRVACGFTMRKGSIHSPCAAAGYCVWLALCASRGKRLLCCKTGGPAAQVGEDTAMCGCSCLLGGAAPCLATPTPLLSKLQQHHGMPVHTDTRRPHQAHVHPHRPPARTQPPTHGPQAVRRPPAALHQPRHRRRSPRTHPPGRLSHGAAAAPHAAAQQGRQQRPGAAESGADERDAGLGCVQRILWRLSR